MFNYDEELGKLDPKVAKAVEKLHKDLCRIKKFKIYSMNPWKSNLPEILPYIGPKMESEINMHIAGVEILSNDQKKRREIRDSLS